MNKEIEEKTINNIVTEFNLLPSQEDIIRRMWYSKEFLIPTRANGWSHTQAILTIIYILLQNSNKELIKKEQKD